MFEDRGDNVGIFDASDHAQSAAAFRAGFDVYREHPFESLDPSHGSERYVRFLLSGFAFWHDRLTMPAIRGEHAVRGAIVERLLEPLDDLHSLAGREPFVGNGRPGNVTADLLELVALAGLAAGGGMERKPRLLGEQGGCEGFGLRRDRAQGQCFLAGIGVDGDTVVDGGADQLIEGLARLEVEEGAVRAPDEEPLSLKRPGHPDAETVRQLSELGGRGARWNFVCPSLNEHTPSRSSIRK